MRIDGREIASKILEDLKVKVKKLQKKNVFPKLAIILVGDDPASVAYVRQKELRAEGIGIRTITYNLESKIQNSELIEIVNKLNKDKNIHGAIIQRPLPSQINEREISEVVDPKKDIDGFHPKSKFEMPIAAAVLRILGEIRASTPGIKAQLIEWLKSKKIVVMGKGETGGRPIANALQKIKINPTIVDSKTKEPQNLTKRADIIICAVGRANVLKPQMIKKGVVLINVGISRGESAKLMGDYDQNEVRNIASFYTPTPGGVGPVNVAMLLKNLVLAAEK